jgi:hypothetical protein
VSISTAAAVREKTQALKEIDRIAKVLRELRDYEDDILYPLATRQGYTSRCRSTWMMG